MEKTILNKFLTYIFRMILAGIAAAIVILSVESISNLLESNSTVAYYVMFFIIFYDYITSLWK